MKDYEKVLDIYAYLMKLYNDSKENKSRRLVGK